MQERYSRQMILPGFGEAAQEKLKLAKVLVVGAGGLGCPALQYLCGAGIGTIGIADGDKVELSNLHRQILFTENDLGRWKCEAARERLNRSNSEVTIQTFKLFIDESNVFDILEDYDIIIDSTDNLAIRFLLNDVCSLLKKPLVFASIFRFEAQISVFQYGDNPSNLRDIYPEIPESSSVPTCSQAGVIGAAVGTIGNMQALEAIKILTGLGEVLSNRLLIMDFLNTTSTKIKINKNPKAFVPTNKEEILSRTYGSKPCFTNFSAIGNSGELEAVLKLDNSVLIDVRNSGAQPEMIQFDSIQIPIEELENSIDQLENYKHLIFVCQAGIKSLQAIEKVSKLISDKKLYNVTQGIYSINERIKA